MLKLIKEIAVDFDGTLCTDAYPAAEHLDTKGLDIVKRFQAAGGRIILWTCRYGKALEDAVSLCKANGLVFDSVNFNSDLQLQTWKEVCQEHQREFGTSPKVYADLYIDDKNPHARINGGIDWDAIDCLINQ